MVAIYSTFLQRGYDQFIHDIAVQDLDVTLAIDRAGLVGADGETHAGAYDFAYLRCVPGVLIMAPADEAECRDMLFTAYQYRGAAAVRYPRGGGPGVAEREAMQALPIGEAEVRLRADDNEIVILAFGSMVAVAEQVAREVGASVVNMRFVKPLDETMITDMANTHSLVVTLEEHVVAGGAGSAVNEVLMKHNSRVKILNLGLPDRHIGHGTQAEQLAECGLDADSIKDKIAGVK